MSFSGFNSLKYFSTHLLFQYTVTFEVTIYFIGIIIYYNLLLIHKFIDMQTILQFTILLFFKLVVILQFTGIIINFTTKNFQINFTTWDNERIGYAKRRCFNISVVLFVTYYPLKCIASEKCMLLLFGIDNEVAKFSYFDLHFQAKRSKSNFLSD